MNAFVTWYGNAAFRLQDRVGTDLYLDPWLTGNPGCPIDFKDVASARWVVVSHGDPGHYRNSVEIARCTGATYVAHRNLCEYIERAGLLPVTQLAALSLGKPYEEEKLSVRMFSVPHPPLDSVAKTPVPREPNCFTLLSFAGLVVGHAGDALFDAEAFDPLVNGPALDLFCLPMSGPFEQAVAQAGEMMRALRPRWAIPAYHYESEARKVHALRTALSNDLAQRVLLVAPGETFPVPVPGRQNLAFRRSPHERNQY